MQVNRRTQRERTAATRAALVAAARELFAERGFATVGTEAIVRAAGVSRGALYHQFEDKAELFAAVLDAVQAEVVAAIVERLGTLGDADVEAVLLAGVDAWLDACADPAVQRIMLLEGPIVLGWARWREAGFATGAGLVEGTLTAAIEAGRLRRQPVRPLAHVLLGALDEAAIHVAHAEDPDATREEVRAVLRDLVAGLLRERSA